MEECRVCRAVICLLIIGILSVSPILTSVHAGDSPEVIRATQRVGVGSVNNSTSSSFVQNTFEGSRDVSLLQNDSESGDPASLPLFLSMISTGAVIGVFVSFAASKSEEKKKKIRSKRFGSSGVFSFISFRQTPDWPVSS